MQLYSNSACMCSHKNEHIFEEGTVRYSEWQTTSSRESYRFHWSCVISLSLLKLLVQLSTVLGILKVWSSEYVIFVATNYFYELVNGQFLMLSFRLDYMCTNCLVKGDVSFLKTLQCCCPFYSQMLQEIF